jgi:hypothetical protein
MLPGVKVVILPPDVPLPPPGRDESRLWSGVAAAEGGFGEPFADDLALAAEPVRVPPAPRGETTAEAKAEPPPVSVGLEVVPLDPEAVTTYPEGPRTAEATLRESVPREGLVSVCDTVPTWSDWCGAAVLTGCALAAVLPTPGRPSGGLLPTDRGGWRKAGD